MNIIKNRLFIGLVAMFGGLLFLLLLSQQLVFADSTGSLLPSSDGNYLQWTPSTGATHYTLVDESACSGTTDYNSTNTVGNRDSYGVALSSIPNGATITDITITPCASRNKGGGGGSATMNVFYRFGGVDSADAGNYALTGTTPTQLASTTFSGLSLSKVTSSTLEIGAILSAGNKGARLSRIAVVITYTPPSPTVTTNAATSITTSSTTLNGSANPNGASTTGWFRYSTTDPGTCDDVFGTRVPTSGGTDLGFGTSSVAYSNGVSGLSSGTTYYYCAVASNSGGTGFGGIVSFTTDSPPPPPTVTTNTATNISTSTATLNGSANPNGASTTGWFRYSVTDPGTCDDVFGTRAPSSGGSSLGAGTSSVPYSFGASGLSTSTTYYYCAIASSTGGGTGFGGIVSFTTNP